MRKESKIRYFRLPADRTTGRKMQELYERSILATQKASELAFALGADSFTASPGAMSGGIGSLIFHKKQSSRAYEQIGRDANGSYVYIPNLQKEKGREIADKFTRLPMVQLRELTNLLNISPEEDMLPAWFKVEDTYYFSCRYGLKAEGVVECSGEEFSQAYAVLDMLAQKEGQKCADA